MQHEKRVYVRRMLRATATIAFATGQLFEVRTMDISRGGMAVIDSANPPVGVEFSLAVTLPLRSGSSVKLHARVKVMHSVFVSSEGGFKVGLQFLELSDAGKSAIEEFLKVIA